MIRWITDNLGTAAYNSLPANLNASIVDVRDLVDKPGNASAIVREKVDQALELLRSGQRVVVCCDYGMSRSNAVAAGVLSRLQGVSFSGATCQVMEVTGEKDIKVEVLRVVRQALEGETLERRIGGRQRILLTGSSGFIGRPLQEALANVGDVFSPSREELNLETDAVALDLYVKEHDISSIVHFANPRVWNTNNSLGQTLVILRNVLDVCKENDIKLIFPSHSEVFSGYKSAEFIALENSEPCPRGLYGETKLLCETLITQYHVQYGLQYILVRSPNIYGKSVVKPHFINRFIKKVLAGQDIITHVYLNGSPYIELLHIDDYITAMVGVVAKDLTGIIHLGSCQRETSKDIALEIGKILNVTVSVESINIHDYASNVRMKYKRAKDVLGWQPKVCLHDGLQELISLNQN